MWTSDTSHSWARVMEVKDADDALRVGRSVAHISRQELTEKLRHTGHVNAAAAGRL